MSLSRKVLSCLLIVSALLLSLSPALALSEVKPKVTIFPLTLNAAEDLAYLRDGVWTMLASRLAAEAGVTVVSKVEVDGVIAGRDNFDPAEVAKTLASDLALVGSITAFGESVSIDARLINISTKESDSFFAATESRSGVIAVVEQLASDITGVITGQGRRRVAPDGQAAVPSPESTGEPGISPDQALHPDRMFKAPTPVPVSPSIPAVASVPAMTAVVPTGQFPTVSRSQLLDLEIQVMDVGDIFGDGSEQIVIAEKQQVKIYRQDVNALIEVATAPAAPAYVRIIAMNLADLNDNGRAEIYISAISDNDPLSYAVEWDGRGFAEIFARQRHYLRPVLVPGKGWILCGQRADLDAPAKPGVYRADSRSGLLTDERLNLPKSANLFDFVQGDFTGDGRLETAVQTQEDDLIIYSDDHSVLWHGSGNFGYNKRFIGPSYAGGGDGRKSWQIPTRLVALDINGDGRQELAAMGNPADGVTTMFKSFGSLDDDSIKIFSWNGITFAEIWSTGAIGNYVASFQLKGPAPHLYLAMITKKSGLLWADKRSVVVSQSLVDVAR